MQTPLLYYLKRGMPRPDVPLGDISCRTGGFVTNALRDCVAKTSGPFEMRKSAVRAASD